MIFLFSQDLNGKQQDWEAVVLIPFMDEKKLLDAMQPIYPKLTPEEAERNRHGPMWVCTYSQASWAPLLLIRQSGVGPSPWKHILVYLLCFMRPGSATLHDVMN